MSQDLVSLVSEYSCCQMQISNLSTKADSYSNQLKALISQQVKEPLTDEIVEVIINTLMALVPALAAEKTKGVRPQPNGKYQARVVMPDGSSPSLGTYNTLIEANAAMSAASKILFLLNKIDVPDQEVRTYKPELINQISISETGTWVFNGQEYNSYIEAFQDAEKLS